MKVGDLVKSILYMGKPYYKAKYGIIVEWYDSANGLVTVYWDEVFGRYEDMNPTHVKNLEVINETR